VPHDIEEFAWNEAKSATCLAERGFDFAYATQVFDDVIATRIDDRFDYGETRWRVLGRVEGRFLVVVYTMRGSLCRIISARQAHLKEVKQWLT
jgi:uncharacterized protein